MPYKSKAQQRAFHAMADSGEIDKETVDKYDKSTKKQKGGFKALPERKARKKDESGKSAAVKALLGMWGRRG